MAIWRKNVLLFFLFSFCFVFSSQFVFAIGIAPSSLQVDYVQAEEVFEDFLVVNTMNFPVQAEFHVDEWAEEFVTFFVDGEELLTLEVSLEAQGQQRVEVLFDFTDVEELSFVSNSFVITVLEKGLDQIGASSSVSLGLKVQINGLLETSSLEENQLALLETNENGILSDVEEQGIEELALLETDGDGVSHDVEEQDIEKSRSDLSGNDLERIYFDHNSGKLFLGITLLIVLILLIHMMYRFLHPEHDF